MTQQMEEDRLVRENDSKEENPYQSMITNDFGKVNFNFNVSQMEQLSIISNNINYA